MTIRCKAKPVPAERMTGNGKVQAKPPPMAVESARGAALRAAMREYRADPAGRGSLQGTGARCATTIDSHTAPTRRRRKRHTADTPARPPHGPGEEYPN
jgi:hypothetical protein